MPDIDLTRFAEQASGSGTSWAICSLPVLVDADDGYGDVKNVTYTVQHYRAMGVAAIFLEDQVAPKRCGHLAGKRVVPAETMINKIKAAAAARSDERSLFIVARTDAREPEGLDSALRRANRTKTREDQCLASPLPFNITTGATTIQGTTARPVIQRLSCN